MNLLMLCVKEGLGDASPISRFVSGAPDALLASYLYIFIAFVYNVLRNSIVFDWVELK